MFYSILEIAYAQKMFSFPPCRGISLGHPVVSLLSFHVFLSFDANLCVYVRAFFFLCSTNVVMNYSEIESKVREATNDDPWGPSGQLMGEIAK